MVSIVEHSTVTGVEHSTITVEHSTLDAVECSTVYIVCTQSTVMTTVQWMHTRYTVEHFIVLSVERSTVTVERSTLVTVECSILNTVDMSLQWNICTLVIEEHSSCHCGMLTRLTVSILGYTY